MKKNRMLINFFLSVFLFSLKTYSHPPAKINLDFNNEEKILKVEVLHPVLSPENHYIKKIEVYLNDSLKIVQNFNRQITKDSQKALYFIFEAKKDDIIKVKGTCNKYGDKTVSLVVQEKKQQNQGK
jgi:desulfoferrodoxin (superoxide reductase-like protein)